MPDRLPPGRPSDGADPGTTLHHEHTAVTVYAAGATTQSSSPAPGPRPPRHGGARRRLGRLLAVAAVVAALSFTGAALFRHFSSDAVSATAMTQPPAPGATGQAPPAWGDGSFGQLGSGSGSGSGGADGSATTADVSAAASRVSPAIVNITVGSDYTSSGGAATGIVLTSDGLVLTSNHVIDGATDISATDVGNGQTYSATVVGYDVTHDIAVIQLQDASDLATASIGDSSSLAIGDTVIGVGNAGGDGGAPTVAAGTVLALDQQIVAGDQADGSSEQLSGLIQTDADIQSGDSGGPLVNADGEVIGVMTAASASSAYSFGSSDTEGFAVPIDTALGIVDQIESGEDSSTVHVGQTAFLGVQTTSASSQDAYGYGDGYSDPYGYGYGDASGSGGTGSSRAGATVTGVVSGSPADGAGLAAGDVITAVDGAAVASASDLSDLIAVHHPGDTVTIGWTDASGSQRSEEVALASGPAK